MIDILILLLFSIIVLVKFSQMVINGATKISELFGISEFVIGFVLVGFFTSLPELIVAVMASISNEGGIVIGNVIGSNMANICFIFAICAIIGKIKMEETTVREHVEILLLITIIPLVMLGRDVLGVVSGSALIIVFLLYSFFIIKRRRPFIRPKKRKVKHVLMTYLTFFGAIFVVTISAKYVVEHSILLSSLLGVHSSLIGLTLIGFGTSLPELAICIAAVRSKRISLAVGNITGSCIVNLTLVLGIAALVNPITGLSIFTSSIVLLTIANVFLLGVLLRYNAVKSIHGLILLAFYIIFLAIETGVMILLA